MWRLESGDDERGNESGFETGGLERVGLQQGGLESVGLKQGGLEIVRVWQRHLAGIGDGSGIGDGDLVISRLGI